MTKSLTMSLAAALLWAGTAAAAAPTVTTGGVEGLTTTGVTLKGSVNPKGVATKAFAQYGKDGKFSSSTPRADVGSGTASVPLRIAVSNLAPGTRYQYRMVAINADGRAEGVIRKFTTPKVPASVTLAVAPTAIRYGQQVTLSGTVGGTGSAGAKVTPQLRAWPFDSAFGRLGDVLTASGQGLFSRTHVPSSNAQYRVMAQVSGKNTLSPVVAVTVKPRVSFRARRLTRRRVSFSGTIRPTGEAVVVLRRLDARSRRITVTRTAAYGSDPSRFRFRPRRLRPGRWLVKVVATGGRLAPVESRIVRVTR